MLTLARRRRGENKTGRQRRNNYSGFLVGEELIGSDAAVYLAKQAKVHGLEERLKSVKAGLSGCSAEGERIPVQHKSIFPPQTLEMFLFFQRLWIQAGGGHQDGAGEGTWRRWWRRRGVRRS